MKRKKPKNPMGPPTGLSAMENVVMELPESPKPITPPPQHKVNKPKIALMIIGGIIFLLLLITASVLLAARISNF